MYRILTSLQYSMVVYRTYFFNLIPSIFFTEDTQVLVHQYLKRLRSQLLCLSFCIMKIEIEMSNQELRFIRIDQFYNILYSKWIEGLE